MFLGYLLNASIERFVGLTDATGMSLMVIVVMKVVFFITGGIVVASFPSALFQMLYS